MVLRQEVFVVEQNCPYLDADGKDFSSWHLMGHDDDGNLMAYARLLPQGASYENYTSIGRVLTASTHRHKGLGLALMKAALDNMERLFPGEKIKVSAQTYLQKFYENFGFVISGPEYLEDGIPHYPMVKK